MHQLRTGLFGWCCGKIFWADFSWFNEDPLISSIKQLLSQTGNNL